MIVGGAAVEGDQFAADIGGELLGVDVRRDTGRESRSIPVGVVRLSRAGHDPGRNDSAPVALTAALTDLVVHRFGRRAGAPAAGPALLAMPVVGHWTLRQESLNVRIRALRLRDNSTPIFGAFVIRIEFIDMELIMVKV